jgi:hypothetical protein
LIDARRIAQIAIFLFGLSHSGYLIRLVATLAGYLKPGDYDLVSIVISISYAAFVLSLLFLSAGWASLVNVPGTVSSFSALARDDLLRVGVALLGLFFLVTGVSAVVAQVVVWLEARSTLGSYGPVPAHSLLDTEALIRALSGAALLFWGSNVVALIRWARTVGTRGAA